jgi:antitoxin (DNA-binding transcriptional repressor) of toxin-antitoxin stability system
MLAKMEAWRAASGNKKVRPMTTISVEEAQERLSELIDQLAPGQELVITRDAQPVATLRAEATVHRQRRQPGSAKDRSHWMAPDFDAPLEEFREYME